MRPASTYRGYHVVAPDSLVDVTVEQLHRGAVPGQRPAAHLVPVEGRPAPEAAAALLLRGEHALYVTGRLTESREQFRAAYLAAESAGQPQDMARAALGLGGIWLAEHRSAAAAADVQMRQQRALQRIGRDTILGRRLTVRLAAESDYRCGEHAAVTAATRAVADDDPVGRAEAISLTHHCLLGPDHVHRRLELAAALLGTAARTGRRFDVLMGLYWRTVDLFHAADPHADRSLTELRAALDESGHLALRYATSALNVTLALRAGAFDRAERLADECAELGAEAGDQDVTGWHGAQLAAIRWYQGRIGELLPALAETVDSPTLSEVDDAYAAGLAVAAAAAGDLRRAEHALARLGPRLSTLARSSSWLVALAGTVEVADAVGERDIAATAYDLLLPFADLPMMASLAIACFGSTQHALGVASLTLGQADRAVAHLRTAVQANEALGHWPAAVLSRHRLTQALLDRNGPDDATAATDLAGRVQSDAVRLGMVLRGMKRRAATATGRPPLRVRRVGSRWLLTAGSLSARVDDAVGMRYLALLIGRPGVDVAATELVAVASGADPGSASAPGCTSPLGGVDAGGDGVPRARLVGEVAVRLRRGGDGALAAGPVGSRQPVLDRAAAAAYRARLARLDDEVADAEADHDTSRAERHRDEKRWLLAELARSAGLGGRQRSFPDDAERARSAVTKAIRRAIDKVAAAEPSLGEPLRSGVRTGTFCRFDPA
jgi:hypothetical protein